MYAVYDITTGRLESVGSVVADDATLEAKGLAKKEVESADGVWNPETLVFDPRAQRAPSMSIVDFLERFTRQERASIRQNRQDDDTLDDWIYRLEMARETIRLDDTRVVEGVEYLESQGTIAEGRAAEVLGNG